MIATKIRPLTHVYPSCIPFRIHIYNIIDVCVAYSNRWRYKCGVEKTEMHDCWNVFVILRRKVEAW